MPTGNPYKEAFSEPANMIGLAGLAAASFATLNPLPFLIGLVAESAYLAFVPGSNWYAARLESKYDQEVLQRRQNLRNEVWQSLTPGTQRRFEKLEVIRNQVGDRMYEGKKWFRNLLRKLDYMMEKFLVFGAKQGQFEQYLLSILAEADPHAVAPPVIQKRKPGPNYELPSTGGLLGTDESVRKAIAKIQAHYQEQIESIASEVDPQTNLHTQAVLEKRQEVLTRRKEFAEKIGETLLNVRHQLDLMEDTFGMINDQIRTLSPEQVIADIEMVVSQTDSLTERLQEVSPFDQAELERGAEELYGS
ncbi:MAG: hypothetical protein JST40_10585 [Armatimonadetes bacterium]|nr:hypothetical protein [Armatimonadota bacterium]